MKTERAPMTYDRPTVRSFSPDDKLETKRRQRRPALRVRTGLKSGWSTEEGYFVWHGGR